MFPCEAAILLSSTHPSLPAHRPITSTDGQATAQPRGSPLTDHHTCWAARMQGLLALTPSPGLVSGQLLQTVSPKLVHLWDGQRGNRRENGKGVSLQWQT